MVFNGRQAHARSRGLLPLLRPRGRHDEGLRHVGVARGGGKRVARPPRCCRVRCGGPIRFCRPYASGGLHRPSPWCATTRRRNGQRDQRLAAHTPGGLQVPRGIPIRRRTAKDRDREDPTLPAPLPLIRPQDKLALYSYNCGCILASRSEPMLPLHLQPESHIPLYVQLRDQLRALVHSGELRTGDRIPASRELASQLGVHRTTVANAYAELESEGLIQGHVGRGTFICGAPVRQFTPPPRTNGHGNGGVRWESLFADERAEEALSRLMPDVPADECAFAAPRPSDDFFPVEEFRLCCNAVLRSEGRRILQLGSTDGYEPLKRVLIEMLRGEGMNVRSEQLLITGGCQQAIDLLCKAFLRPGDAVALENPAYPGAIAIFSGARVRALAVGVETDSRRNGYVGLDVNALESVLMQNRVKFIFVTPDFHNPTGTTLPVAERRRLLEIAARYQVPVIEDYIYARLRLRGTAVPSLKSLDRTGNVIHIDSFSKIAFPGLRVGWCIGPESVIERLRVVKQSTDLHTDQLSQAALAEFVRRGHLARH